MSTVELYRGFVWWLVPELLGFSITVRPWDLTVEVRLTSKSPILLPDGRQTRRLELRLRVHGSISTETVAERG